MPLYTFQCPGCGTTQDDYRHVAHRDEPAVCACGTTAPRIFNPGSGRHMIREFDVPIEMMSVAVNNDDEIRDFIRRNPDAEISTNKNDPRYGIPIARTRQQKLSILENEGFYERN